MNVYIYWYGDEKIKESIQNKFDKLSKNLENINFILGPTKKEHEYLLQEYDFYRKAIKTKKYAFAADLYRVWKLSQEKCMYIDSTVEINKNKFNSLSKKIKDYETLIIKENGHLVWNGIQYSKNKSLYQTILFFYKQHPRIAYSLTGPIILSIFFYRFYGCKLNNKNVLFLDARDIDPFSSDSIFNYNGLGSWGNKEVIDWNHRIQTGAHNYFHKNAIKFEKGISKYWIIIRWCIKHYLIYLLPIVIFKK